MIELNTYVTLLFSIVISLVSIFIAINMGNICHSKKRKLLFISFFFSFILIIIATLLHYLNGNFHISNLLPFTKEQFSEPFFITKYKKYCIISVGYYLAIYAFILSNCDKEIGIRADASIAFDKKYAIITLLFHFFISTYIHIWLIYGLCYFSFKIFVTVIISIVVSIIELCILYNINKYLPLEKKNIY